MRQFANLRESVELFVPDSEQWDKKVDHFPIRTGGERICAVDWHQVSDSYTAQVHATANAFPTNISCHVVSCEHLRNWPAQSVTAI